MKLTDFFEKNSDKQVMSLYNPDGETYRGASNKIPNSKSISNQDITVKGKRADFPDDSYEPDPLAGLNKEQIVKLINNSLDMLSNREAIILKARFGIKPFTVSMTLSQVGDALGINKESVRQVEARALRKLKHPKISRNLRPLLGEDMMPQLADVAAMAAVAGLAAPVMMGMLKAAYNTGKGFLQLKKIAQHAGVKLADRVIGEADEQPPLPVNLTSIENTINQFEVGKSINAEEADQMREAIKSLVSSRQTDNPQVILQLLTLVLG